MTRLGLAVLLVLPLCALADAPQKKRTPRQALREFRDLIGSWRSTGTPTGSQQDQQKNFWTGTMDWEWRFKGRDAWLQVRFEKDKYFTGGELRYLPADDRYQLTLNTTDKQALTFTGPLTDRLLTLEREDAGRKETQRLVFNFLHSNRFLYRYEVRAGGKGLFRPLYRVGVTKEGVPFAGGDGRPECIVSGGLGTMPVNYQGKTYYVCCSGCRDEFNANPAKYVREYEAKKAKKGAGAE